MLTPGADSSNTTRMAHTLLLAAGRPFRGHLAVQMSPEEAPMRAALLSCKGTHATTNRQGKQNVQMKTQAHTQTMETCHCRDDHSRRGVLWETLPPISSGPSKSFCMQLGLHFSLAERRSTSVTCTSRGHLCLVALKNMLSLMPPAASTSLPQQRQRRRTSSLVSRWPQLECCRTPLLTGFLLDGPRLRCTPQRQTAPH